MEQQIPQFEKLTSKEARKRLNEALLELPLAGTGSAGKMAGIVAAIATLELAVADEERAAMEEQHREQLDRLTKAAQHACNTLYSERAQYVSAEHGCEHGCDVEFERCEECGRFGDNTIEHTEECSVYHIEESLDRLAEAGIIPTLAVT